MDVYSFASTVLIVNGHEVQGNDEGEDVITAARREDSASDKVGVDGKMVVSLNPNKSGVIAFKLLHTSNSNAVLSALVAAAENGAFVPVAVQFFDTEGKDLANGSNGYIVRPADMGRGATVGSQEWSIVVERLDMLHAGAE